MGEEADYLLDQMLINDSLDYDDMFGDSELQWRFSNNIWTTQDGSTRRLSEMTDSHLRNSISWIERHGDDCVYGFGAKWLPKLKLELWRRNTLPVKVF